MRDLSVELHWGQVFGRNTKIVECYHYLSEGGIYKAATEVSAWVIMYFLKKLRKNKALALGHRLHKLQGHQ